MNASERLAKANQTLAKVEGILRGMSVAEARELEHIDRSIEATKNLLESLEKRKVEIQKSIAISEEFFRDDSD